jgi:hypothetical protein
MMRKTATDGSKIQVHQQICQQGGLWNWRRNYRGIFRRCSYTGVMETTLHITRPWNYTCSSAMWWYLASTLSAHGPHTGSIHQLCIVTRYTRQQYM